MRKQKLTRYMFGLKELERRLEYQQRWIGRFSYYDSSGDVLSKQWTEKESHLILCSKGWHFWSPRNKRLWYPIRTDLGAIGWSSSSVFLIQAHNVLRRIMKNDDKSVAQRIRYIREITKKERRELCEAENKEQRFDVFRKIVKATNPKKLKIRKNK